MSPPTRVCYSAAVQLPHLYSIYWGAANSWCNIHTRKWCSQDFSLFMVLNCKDVDVKLIGVRRRVTSFVAFVQVCFCSWKDNIQNYWHCCCISSRALYTKIVHLWAWFTLPFSPLLLPIETLLWWGHAVVMICVEFVQLVGKFCWKYYTNKCMFNIEELKTHT